MIDKEELRRRAEEIARKKTDRFSEDSEALSPEKIRQAIHDLQVHQIELEMQNEELRRSQEKLNASRARYFDLYDLAPIGYITLSETGQILEANLFAVALLGVTRSSLVTQFLTAFIFREDEDIHYLSSKLLLKSAKPQTWELRMVKKDGTLFWANLDGNIVRNEMGETQFRIILSDISGRKEMEAALNERAKELACISAVRAETQNNLSEEDFCRKVIALLIPAIQFPEFAFPVIDLDGQQFAPGTAAGKVHQYLSAGIKLGNENTGELRVYYTAELPFIIPEKHNLIDTVAVSIGLYLMGLRAGEKIKSLLDEKEFILKEVHHRIKNNMSTIKSILALQAMKLNEPAAQAALNDAGSRVQSMMVLYDKLFLAERYSDMPVRMYLPALIDQILANFPESSRLNIEKNVDDFILDTKRLSTLGIIINELLTNIMKYAFADGVDGMITVSASLKDNRVTVIIQDNGRGIPVKTGNEKPGGFGFTLISILVKQLNGTMKIESEKGTTVVLEFQK